MGMFSFIKDIGEKLFGSGAAQTAVKPADVAKPTDEEIAKALMAKVAALGLKVKDLDITFNGGAAYVMGTASAQDVREKVILVVGNTAGVESVHDNLAVDKPEPQAKFYTVVTGDTLSKISKDFYGNANKYMKIFQANEPMLKHPDKIYPGQMLRIPE